MKVWKKKKLTGKYGKIQETVEKELSCSAHNIDHTMRVYNMALNIAKQERDVDLDVLKMAALLHDIARVKEDDDKTGNVCHAEESSKMAEPILKNLGYSANKIGDIKHCILSHRHRTNNKPESIEAKILFDADKLDSLGAIFMIRAGAWMARHNCPIFPQMGLKKYIKINLIGEKEDGRIKDPSKHSLYYEFEIKNRKLPQLMFTKTGKKIARQRLRFDEIFLDRLAKEVEGIL
ncbi:MAG TPA: phosphohydrolase [Candidatus Moranbacteria bacterium]|nr:MAG: Metal dependent phosphohydrolase [Candidatus Moranbacteria bacterium GW2011_GWC2_45_10]KKT95452.1 MAG: Metal dependent phosphohydrolase [Parcubacteria group bacterium GW2011_GWC1_45_14]HAV11858.1 phosphohydrolase [Candidatus Moranbacteria bacterium]